MINWILILKDTKTAKLNKLWRILYSPRNVFDEIKSDLQIAYPVVAILGAIAITAFAIAHLAPYEGLTKKQYADYQNELKLLEDEPYEKFAEARKAQIQEEMYGPSDRPHDSRMTASPWAPVIWPLGWLIYFVLLGTSFSIVGNIIKSGIEWSEWFGFACWCQVPLILAAAINVLLVVTDLDGYVLRLYSYGDWEVGLGSTDSASSLWWVWSFIISVLGLRSWTSKGIGVCMGWVALAHIFLLAPFFLLVGGLFFLTSILA